MKFYTYTHSTDDGRVFYVGKGHGKRAWVTRGRSRKHQNISKKHGCNVSIVWYATCEEQAFAIEMMNIDFHGTYHYDDPKGIGCNFTKGGEGNYGLKMSDETKMEMSRSRRGKPNLKNRNRAAWNKGKKMSKEFCLNVARTTKDAMGNLSESKKLEMSNNSSLASKGKPKSPSHRKKISDAKRKTPSLS